MIASESQAQLGDWLQASQSQQLPAAVPVYKLNPCRASCHAFSKRLGLGLGWLSTKAKD